MCSCLHLRAVHPVTLFPNKITLCEAKLDTIICPGTVLQRQNHLCNKPWRMMHEYLQYSEEPLEETKYIVPLISSKYAVISTDQSIGHVRIIPASDALTFLEGKTICI